MLKGDAYMTQAEARAAAWAREHVGNGYIWGATGWVCSRERREQQAKQYLGQADMILGVGAKWDGMICWDCATFVRGAAKAGGVMLCSGARPHGRRWEVKRCSERQYTDGSGLNNGGIECF